MTNRIVSFFYQPALVRFLLFGGIGFLSNIALFLYLKHKINILAANLFSYLAAVTLTWLLNRLLTFHSSDAQKAREWFRYLLVYILTGTIQVVLFTALIHEYRTFYLHPVIAIMIAAMIVAFMNFFLSKRFAFKHHSSEASL